MTRSLVPSSPQLSRVYTWFSAISSEDTVVMEDLLMHGLPVDVPHPLRHTTALMEATRLGRATLVQWLLTRGAAPAFLCGIPRGTPLHSALRRHDWAIARILIDASSSCAMVDGYGRTALHVLSMDTPDADRDVAQALELANRMVERHCVLDALDQEGVTALHYCVINDFLALAQLLLTCGADPNVRAQETHVTPLIIAALERNPAMARVLLEHGADPKLATKDGSTPLSIMPGMKQIIKQLSGDATTSGKQKLTAAR